MIYGESISNIDYYAMVQELIILLENEGNFIHEAKLQSPIDDWTTGEEILMKLRFYLIEIINRISLE